MKKILTFGITILFLNVLVLAGLVGFVVATGRLDAAKWHTILDLLRWPGTPEGLRDKVAVILEPSAASAPASQPATMLAPVENGLPASAAASAAERIQYARQAMEQERLRLERAAQDLLQRQKLLETQRADMVAKLAKLEEERAAFQKQLQAMQDQSKNESFTRTKALYDDLKPKQVKDLFVGLPVDVRVEVVANYLMAMETERATKIIGEFKSEDEKKLIGQVLEKIRGNGMGSATSPVTPSTSAPIPALQGGPARN